MTADEFTLSGRFCDQDLRFGDIVGVNLTIASASPRNYYDVISNPGVMPQIDVDGKLFLPSSSGEFSLIILVPGSLGVAPSHVSHARTLTAAGFAVFILDSFGARHVTSTVANQTQFSFAASAYDVLCAYKVLANHPQIDARRIGLQGHSRGGSAALTAATRCFANTVIGSESVIRGVLAAYPWCGQQFSDPGVGGTEVRVLIGAADEWCSPMQAQAYCHAIRLCGGKANMRLFGGAHHSFDRDSPVTLIPDASVSPAAPIAFIANDGAMVHPLESEAKASWVDRDLMVWAVKAGFGVKGAHIGSHSGEAQLFIDDMVEFWQRVLQ